MFCFLSVVWECVGLREMGQNCGGVAGKVAFGAVGLFNTALNYKRKKTDYVSSLDYIDLVCKGSRK